MLILIDNYDSFAFNLVHFLGELGAQTDVHRNDRITVDDVVAARPDAIVLSPGPCTPNEAGICLDLIAKAAPTIPILGVCLGHQAVGQASRGQGGRPTRCAEGCWRGGIGARAFGGASRALSAPPAIIPSPSTARASPTISPGPPRPPTASSWGWRTGASPCTACNSIPRASRPSTV